MDDENFTDTSNTVNPAFYASLRTIILRDIAGLRRGDYPSPHPAYYKSRQRDLAGLRAMRAAS